MSIIYVLIPIAILLTAIGIYLFFWAVKTEQFDDLEKQGMSILFDEESVKPHATSVDSIQSAKADNNALDIKAAVKNSSDNVVITKPANK